MARKTIENFVARAIRIYEQEPGEANGSSRLGVYVRRSVRWARAGLPLGGGAYEYQLGCVTKMYHYPAE